MVIEKFWSEISFSTYFALELEVGSMTSLMLPEVRFTAKRPATFTTFVGFDATVCKNVRFQLVWTVELLLTT